MGNIDGFIHDTTNVDVRAAGGVESTLPHCHDRLYLDIFKSLYGTGIKEHSGAAPPFLEGSVGRYCICHYLSPSVNRSSSEMYKVRAKDKRKTECMFTVYRVYA